MIYAPTRRNTSVFSAASTSESETSQVAAEQSVPFCEVSQERYEARLAVADVIQKASAGYDATPQYGDEPAVATHRREARRLDAKIQANLEAEASEQSFDAEGSAMADPEEADMHDQSAEDAATAGSDEVAIPLRIAPRRSASDCYDDVQAYVDACAAVNSTLNAVLNELAQANLDEEAVGHDDDLIGVCDDPTYIEAVEALLAARQAADAEAERLMQQLSEQSSAMVPPFARQESPIVQAFVPQGYRLAPDGVFFKDDEKKPELRLSMKPLCVDALVRDSASGGWAARVRAVNLEGKLVSVFVPLSGLSSGKSNWCAEIQGQGIPVLNEAALSKYLKLSLGDAGLPKMLGVNRMGFVQTRRADGELTLCFVLPGQTYYVDGETVAEEVVLLPQARAAIHAAYHASGELSDWQGMVEVTRGNPLQTFVLCMAVATPLLQFGGVENGGVHIYCGTSNGKTIVLQVAATVFGNGARSGLGGAATLVQSWHGTANAIEMQTATCSGTLAVFDEVGVNRGPVSPYSQMGGQTKGRAQADGSLQKSMTWTTQILSSGEVSMAQQIESKTGRAMMGGEATRMADVFAGDLLGRATAQEAETLRANCGVFYGTAGPAFVQWLLNTFQGDAEALEQQLTAAVDTMRDRLCDEARVAGAALQNQHVRVMRRFALSAVAGCWAVQAGVFPHTEDEVMDAVRVVRDAWLEGLSEVSMGAKGIQKLRDYVELNRELMPEAGGEQERFFVPGMDPGILHDGCVLLTQEAFAEVVRGLDVDLVGNVLEAMGILRRKDDQKKAQVSIAELGVKKQRFYHLDLARLFGEPETADEAVEDAGEASEA